MKPFLIQPVGIVEYAHQDKPINYTPSFLTGLTNQKKITIRDQHSGKLITEVTDLFYQDGGLYGYSKDEFDITNRGISPIFDVNKVIEYDDCIEPLSAEIKSVDVVDNPRNIETLLYNSSTVVENKTKKDNGSDDLGNESELQRKIGALEIEVNNAKKAEEKVKNKLTAKETQYNDLKTKYDALKTKYDGYEAKENATVETLAEELAKEDKGLLEVYKNMSLEQLKVLKSKEDSKIADEIKNKAKELSFDNEDYQKVLEKLSLKQLETIEKANEEWDTALNEKYKNDTGFKGAGIGQNQLENKHGDKNKDKNKFKTREEYDNIVGNETGTKRPVFSF